MNDQVRLAYCVICRVVYLFKVVDHKTARIDASGGTRMWREHGELMKCPCGHDGLRQTTHLNKAPKRRLSDAAAVEVQ